MKKKFYIGQKLLWIFEELGKRYVLNYMVTEVHEDHTIAIDDNDGTSAYIDEDNEMQFFDYELNSMIHGLR